MMSMGKRCGQLKLYELVFFYFIYNYIFILLMSNISIMIVILLSLENRYIVNVKGDELLKSEFEL